MNITVFGATGMVGSWLVTEAVSRGHRVTAASRHPHAARSAAVIPVTVDAGAPADRRDAALDEALGTAGAALLAIRPAPGQEDSIAPLTSAVLDAAGRAGVRLLVVGGAGPLRSPRDPGLLVIDDPDHVPAAEASSTQLRTCHEHGYGDWTYLSPPALLEPGARTGTYRRGTTTLLTEDDGTSRISAEDLAVAALDEIERPRGERHFTVVRSSGERPGR
ncbi:NAD(P)H-binding protein [Streptomyces sp. ITFR-6]|uniref:NAD(P)-dependent oxidoreductase n=1 Tax=Streptomyces sp. ITFR-6 TaxID=3075197 RepID=UPI002889EE95|nr:NAD(P)H-binding protein [Streptomyces sp. ITFR-6]WNI32056.1 NAD(P)H-binding protein [Streptomyces sp. ITFR-6]